MITPVPKGVGPMTIAMLLENTLEAYRKHLIMLIEILGEILVEGIAYGTIGSDGAIS